jgi:hypothetical protein
VLPKADRTASFDSGTRFLRLEASTGSEVTRGETQSLPVRTRSELRYSCLDNANNQAVKEDTRRSSLVFCRTTARVTRAGVAASLLKRRAAKDVVAPSSLDVVVDSAAATVGFASAALQQAIGAGRVWYLRRRWLPIYGTLPSLVKSTRSK